MRTLGYPVSLENIYPSILEGPLSTTKPIVTGNEAKTVGLERSGGSLAIHQATTKATPRASAKTTTVVYPVFDLYPAVYPYSLLEIYPAVVHPGNVATVPVPTVSRSAPVPASLPTVSAHSGNGFAPATQPSFVQHVKMSRGYPFMDLYPAVYPRNLESIYPAVRTQAAKRTTMAPVTKPINTATRVLPSIHVHLSPQYPALDLFPAVYPYNLERIYPTTKKSTPVLSNVKPSQTSNPLSERSTVKVEVPAISNLRALEPRKLAVRGIEVRLARTYPNMELYVPVYPFNLVIYPTTAWKAGVASKKEKVEQPDAVVAVHAAHLELGML